MDRQMNEWALMSSAFAKGGINEDNEDIWKIIVEF